MSTLDRLQPRDRLALYLAQDIEIHGNTLMAFLEGEAKRRAKDIGGADMSYEVGMISDMLSDITGRLMDIYRMERE